MNITFTADEKLIARARRNAVKKGRSLQSEVREWLAQYANQPSPAKELDDLLLRLRRIRENAQQASEEMHKRS